ncbi:interleukin-17D [Microcaecilia unicolor]|uniref:Interleukin-17D-like n=1 Tax=Microcaecilia unicolor TaxID=1415580 RepID=A0A6P7YS61_9AMPH|nr:interleukin-17D-like [Microcaecilia unicolor]
MLLKVAVVTWVIMTVTFHSCLGKHTPCQDPSEENLEAQIGRLAPAYHLLVEKENITPDRELKKCPNALNQTSDLIQDTSISPWSFRVNEDPERYPRKITEAYCLCKGCFMTPNEEDKSLISEPFLMRVPVLQKTRRCVHGHYKYRLTYVKVAQFCNCHLP